MSDIATAALMISNCQRNDFAASFSKQYPTNEAQAFYVTRLISLITKSGIPVEYWLDGYDVAAAKSVNFFPNSQQIRLEAEVLFKNAQQHAKNLAQNEKVYFLCNDSGLDDKTPVIEILSVFREDSKKALINPLASEDRKSILNNHDRLLKNHKSRGKINSVGYSEEHQCSYYGCNSVGSLSQTTVGGGNFYCKKHYRAV
jgi:hypothetical protein